MQVVPTMVMASTCIALAAAVSPFALSDLLAQGYWKALGSVALGVAVMLALAGLFMLYQAYATVIVFTDLHRSIKWNDDHVCSPTTLQKWVAGPKQFTQVPLLEDSEVVDGDDDDDA